jgi:hypothetical protein
VEYKGSFYKVGFCQILIIAYRNLFSSNFS